MRIDNERMFQTISKDISSTEAYSQIDDITWNLIKCIFFSTMTGTDTKMSLDLTMADIETVLKNSGKFYFSTGTSSIKEGAMLAYKRAINNPFIDYSIENTTKLIVHIENVRQNENTVMLNSIKEKASKKVIIFLKIVASEVMFLFLLSLPSIRD